MLLGENKKKPRHMHAGILESMSHLMMTKKRLSSIIQVDSEGQVKTLLGLHCPKLTHIFLQENYLTFIGQPAFKGCNNILQINLFNNLIQKMDCFNDCAKLQKLYLEGNQISRLEGLTNCSQLREIYIGN